FARARRVGELLLSRGAGRQQLLQLGVERAPRGERLDAPALAAGAALPERSKIEGGDRGLEALDLFAELRRALGRGGLERQRPQPLAYLGLEVARPLDLRRDAGELELGAMAAELEAAEPRSLLDERTALGRLRAEDGLDAPLRDDRAKPAAEAHVGEDLDEVDAAHGGTVDEVLALTAAVQAARERAWGEGQLGRGSVVVVEDELDLAEVDRLATRRAGEEDVVGLLRPELVRAERARGPQDRVRDVRLAGAVRADDDRDPRLQANLDRVHERLEPSQLDRLEMHESGTLAGGPDTLLGRQTGERLPGRVLLGVLLRAAPA